MNANVRRAIRTLFCATALMLPVISGALSVREDPSRENYTILSHRVRIQLLPGPNFINCTDTLTLRLDGDDREEIRIGLSRIYDLHEIRLNGDRRSPVHRGDQIVLDDLPEDSVAELVVSYSGKFPHASEFSTFSQSRAILREEECLPFGPKDYRSVRITIVAPQEWRTVTAGECVRTATADGVTSWVWEMNQPIPLIGWICAGEYVVQQRSGGIAPLSSYLFSEDSASAPRVLGLSDSVLSFYSGAFSPYRFKDLKIVEVDDEIAGPAFLAIAQPSMILMKKHAYTTEDSYNRAEAVIPHEIAHQWWPITVNVKEEDIALLSEGMCEYSAMLYGEHAGSSGKRDSLTSHPLLGPLIARAIKGEDLPLRMKADFRSLPTHYLKSAFVHNMLRREIGDSAFRSLFREYAHRYALATVSMVEFQSLAEELSGKRLGAFFDQWVKQKGIPRLRIYNVKASRVDGRWVTRGRVRIPGYEKFTALVDVGVVTPGGIAKQRIAIGADSAGIYRNDVGFEIPTPVKPLRAILDPDGDILKIRKIPVKLSDLRDPSSGVMIVGTAGGSEHLLTVARRDSAHLGYAGWELQIKYDTSITLADLQRDKLFIYGKSSENRVAGELASKFPMKMVGDSIFTASGTLFDSSLTLIQAIENPYRQHGIAVWIAPLSVRADPRLLPFDASWIVCRGKEEISTGTWTEKDEYLEVEIP